MLISSKITGTGLYKPGKTVRNSDFLNYTFYKNNNADPINFDTSHLDEVHEKAGLKCPEMNETNFQLLLDFAKGHDFGLRLN